MASSSSSQRTGLSPRPPFALFAAVLRPSSGRSLWLPWFAAGLACVASYWSVMARTVLLVVPPAVFCLAALLEARLPKRRYAAVCLSSLVVVFCLGLGLAVVDDRYAASQKSLSQEVAERYLARGRPPSDFGGSGTPAPATPGADRKASDR